MNGGVAGGSIQATAQIRVAKSIGALYLLSVEAFALPTSEFGIQRCTFMAKRRRKVSISP
jgi:hypothetical protein